MADVNELKGKERHSNNSTWTGGAILIAIGLIFLAANFTDFGFTNWWALFILVPVLAMWGNALRCYQSAGRMTQEVSQQVAGSLFPLFIALIFLLEWDWGQVWPGFIIIAGINALASGMFSD